MSNNQKVNVNAGGQPMTANGKPVGPNAVVSGNNIKVKNNSNGSVTATVPNGNVKVNGNKMGPNVTLEAPKAEVNTSVKNAPTNLNVKSTNGPLLVNGKPVAPEGANVLVKANNANVKPSNNGGAIISSPEGVTVAGQNMGPKVNVSSQKGNVKVTTPQERVASAMEIITNFIKNQPK